MLRLTRIAGTHSTQTIEVEGKLLTVSQPSAQPLSFGRRHVFPSPLSATWLCFDVLARHPSFGRTRPVPRAVPREHGAHDAVRADTLHTLHTLHALHTFHTLHTLHALHTFHTLHPRQLRRDWIRQFSRLQRLRL